MAASEEQDEKMLDVLPTDFCSLPIVIDDGTLYNTTTSAVSQSQIEEAASSSAPTTDSDKSPDEEDDENGVEDLVADFADAILDAAESIWQRFSSSTTSHVRQVCKSKVRAVCLEVIKRTEEPETQNNFAYDDDARFLD